MSASNSDNPKRNSAMLVVSAFVLALFPVGVWYLNQQKAQSQQPPGSTSLWEQNLDMYRDMSINPPPAVDDSLRRYTFYQLLPRITVEPPAPPPPLPPEAVASLSPPAPISPPATPSISAGGYASTAATVPAQPQTRQSPEVPAAAITDYPAAVRTQPAPAPRQAIIQAGVFSSHELARRQSAKLLLLGLKPEVKARYRDGRDQYVISIGPVAPAALADTRRRLERAGVDYLVRR